MPASEPARVNGSVCLSGTSVCSLGACGKTRSITRRTGPLAGIASMASSASRVGVLASTPPSAQ